MKKGFVLAIFAIFFACFPVNAAEPADPVDQFLLAQKYEKGDGRASFIVIILHKSGCRGKLVVRIPANLAIFKNA